MNLNFVFTLLRRNSQLLLLILCFITNSKIFGATGISFTGNWNQASTWLIGGVNRTPDCGDTITIPAGATVTLTSMENYYYCTQGIVIYVNGTLQLVNGYKMRLPCGSSVVIQPGGILKKSTPGFGNSTYIHICHCDAWTADDGPVPGPSILTCSTLPVNLLNFSASTNESTVILTWSTASEINNDRFDVERSSDGKNFFSILQLKGNGTTDVTHEYSGIDDLPLNGISYYRLRQTDFDGTTTCTEPVAVKIKTSNEFTVNAYYSATLKTIQCRLINAANQHCTVRVIDMFGKEVNRFIIGTTELVQTFEINSSGMNGQFILLFDDGETQEATRIVVM